MKRILGCALVGLYILSFSYSYSYAQDDHSHDHGHKMPAIEKSENLGICPVMGGEASPEYSYDYEGETYYFCCPSCIEEFKKNPVKYTGKIKKIKLEAYQFGFSPDLISVKKGDIVKLTLTTRDVPHGVYIKEYGIDIPVAKDQQEHVEFIADKTGEFDILCSVYCGSGHHQMQGKLIVEE